MGRFKKTSERNLKGMARAHKMAEAFAKNRTKDFVKAFVEDTDLLEHLEPKASLEDVQTWFDNSFGKALAIAYACGFCDAIQGATITQLYVPKGLEVVKPSEEESKQLVLPGVLD
jgi:hypothetical protein